MSLTKKYGSTTQTHAQYTCTHKSAGFLQFVYDVPFCAGVIITNQVSIRQPQGWTSYRAILPCPYYVDFELKLHTLPFYPFSLY